MAESKPKRSGSKRRRWVRLLVVLLLLLTAVWHGLPYLLQLDRYIPTVQAQIERQTGLPSEIGHIDLDLFPPSVDIMRVRVGEGDFQAEANQVSLHLLLGPLLSRRIVVNEVRIWELQVTAPAGTLDESIGAIVHAQKTKEKRPKRFDITVNRVRATDATLHLTGQKDAVATFDLVLQDVLADTLSARLDAVLPGAGRDATVTAEATVYPKEKPVRFSGQVNATGLEPDAFLENPNTPDVRIDILARAENATVDQARFDLTGTVSPGATAQQSVTALAGDFSAAAWWQEGAVTLNDIAWKAPGATLEADLTRYANGDVGCHIRQAEFNAASLKSIVHMADTDWTSLEASDKAALVVSDLLVGAEDGGTPRLVRGSAQASGFALTVNNATMRSPIHVAGIHGEAAVHEGVFSIASLNGDGISLQGQVRPDFESGAVAIEASGNAAITREALGAFFKTDALGEVQGELNLDSLSLKVAPGDTPVQSFELRGSVKQGAFEVKTEAFEDSLSAVEAAFTTNPDAVAFDVSAHSTQLGSLAIAGRLPHGSGALSGTAQAELASLTLPLEPGSAAERIARAALALYEQHPCEFTIALPEQDEKILGITLQQTTVPGFNAELEWVQTGGKWTLNRAFAKAQLPADVVREATPESLHAEGLSEITFTAPPGADRFTADVDATPVMLAYGANLSKRPGAPLKVSATGVTTPKWQVQDITLNILGEMVQGRVLDEGLSFPDINIAAGPLAALLPEGAKANGRITGAITTNPVNADLQFSAVSFDIPGAKSEMPKDEEAEPVAPQEDASQDASDHEAPPAGAGEPSPAPSPLLETIDGRIAYQDARLALDTLRVVGANSDITMDGTYENGVWDARLDGKRLDINEATRLWEDVKAFTRRGGEPSEPTPARSRPAGTLSIDIDEVQYRRGLFSDLKAKVDFEPDRVAISDLYTMPYEGTLRGTASWHYAGDTTPARLVTDLTLNQANAKIIDDIAFEKPRNIAGAFTGTVNLTVPLAEGVPPTHGADGLIQLEGADGTFGQLGIATKLLTVLRATEVVQLRLPSLKDKGLAFDTCAIDVTLTNGLLEVQTMNMRNPTMSVVADGNINFAKDETNLTFRVSLLGAVTGLMEVVGLGEAAKEVRESAGFVLAATGPIESPKVSVTQSPAAGAIKGTVKGGAAVGEALTEKAGEAIKGLLGQ